MDEVFERFLVGKAATRKRLDFASMCTGATLPAGWAVSQSPAQASTTADRLSRQAGQTGIIARATIHAMLSSILSYAVDEFKALKAHPIKGMAKMFPADAST